MHGTIGSGVMGGNGGLRNSEGDSDIGLLQGSAVIGVVADHGHSLAEVLKTLDDILFVLWRASGEY